MCSVTVSWYLRSCAQALPSDSSVAWGNEIHLQEKIVPLQLYCICGPILPSALPNPLLSLFICQQHSELVSNFFILHVIFHPCSFWNSLPWGQMWRDPISFPSYRFLISQGQADIQCTELNRVDSLSPHKLKKLDENLWRFLVRHPPRNSSFYIRGLISCFSQFQRSTLHTLRTKYLKKKYSRIYVLHLLLFL